jgi:hypothetical protein
VPQRQKQAELFERAAKCHRALEATTDIRDRASLKILCELWTKLANESMAMTDAELAQEVAAVEQIHAAVFGPREDKAAE